MKRKPKAFKLTKKEYQQLRNEIQSAMYATLTRGRGWGKTAAVNDLIKSGYLAPLYVYSNNKNYMQTLNSKSIFAPGTPVVINQQSTDQLSKLHRIYILKERLGYSEPWWLLDGSKSSVSEAKIEERYLLSFPEVYTESIAFNQALAEKGAVITTYSGIPVRIVAYNIGNHNTIAAVAMPEQGDEHVRLYSSKGVELARPDADNLTILRRYVIAYYNIVQAPALPYIDPQAYVSREHAIAARDEEREYINAPIPHKFYF